MAVLCYGRHFSFCWHELGPLVLSEGKVTANENNVIMNGHMNDE